jgi:hypothetical protein
MQWVRRIIMLDPFPTILIGTIHIRIVHASIMDAPWPQGWRSRSATAQSPPSCSRLSGSNRGSKPATKLAKPKAIRARPSVLLYGTGTQRLLEPLGSKQKPDSRKETGGIMMSPTFTHAVALLDVILVRLF